MAFDKMDAQFYSATSRSGSPPTGGSRNTHNEKKEKSAAPADKPRQSSEGSQSHASAWGVGLGSAASRGLNNQSSQGTLNQWMDSSLAWGGRDIAAHTGDKVGYYVETQIKAKTRQTKPLEAKPSQGSTKTVEPKATGRPDSSGVRSQSIKAKDAQGGSAVAQSGKAGLNPTAGQAGLSYSNIFRLNDKTVDWKNVSWKNYKDTVQHNVKDFKAGIQNEGGKFFSNKNITAGRYLKETVVGENVKPVQNLVNGSDKNWGSGAVRTASFAMISTDIAKKTKQAHQNAKAKEDGSFKSKLNTAKETTQTFAGQTAKSVISWEAGGLAFAAGKALLPFSATIPGLGLALPVGGIILGGLGGSLAHQALDKVIPDPPVPQKADQKDASPTEAKKTFKSPS